MSESEPTAMEPEYDRLTTDELEFEGVRDIRENVVAEVKQRLKEHEYNPARPLRVVPENGHYVVADGNHRLKALEELEWQGEVPCVIEPGADIHTVAVNSNRDEDTYAPSDLFDSLDRLQVLRESGEELTQEEIGAKIGWGRGKVNQFVMLLENVDTAILDSARTHQKGRVSADDTSVSTFNFTEGWFRTSGIYDLDAERQQDFAEWFIEEKNCKPSKNQVTSKTDGLAAIQAQLETLDAELNGGVEDGERESIREEILSNAYTDDSLQDAIRAANEGAKDRTYFGEDAVDRLGEFDANEFACVVTDPPYGVDYGNFRDSGRPAFGESAPDALKLLESVFEELQRVCKADAHLYVFFPTRLYPQIREIAGEFFDVEPVPLVWSKNNIAPTQNATGGFKQMYAQQYETLFHLRGPNGDARELNGDSSPNVLEYDIPKGKGRWHDSQKPTGLWEELLGNSTAVGETILDPFAGSGTALLAAKRMGRHYVGIEQNGSYESRFTKELRKIESGEGGDSDV